MIVPHLRQGIQMMETEHNGTEADPIEATQVAKTIFLVNAPD
jgi:hypothetical protein